MKGVVIQSVWLTIAILLLFTMGGGSWIAYIGAFVLGLIPLFYLKKNSDKEILKFNLWSSIIATGVLGIIYAFFIFLVQDFNTPLGPGNVWMTILSIIELRNLFPGLLYALILFNIPFLIYFFFGKKA